MVPSMMPSRQISVLCQSGHQRRRADLLSRPTNESSPRHCVVADHLFEPELQESAQRLEVLGLCVRFGRARNLPLRICS